MQFSGVCIIVSEYYCSDSCRQRGLYRVRINFYRVLNLANQLIRRTREHQYKRPEVLKAVAPNQCGAGILVISHRGLRGSIFISI